MYSKDLFCSQVLRWHNQWGVVAILWLFVSISKRISVVRQSSEAHKFRYLCDFGFDGRLDESIKLLSAQIKNLLNVSSGTVTWRWIGAHATNANFIYYLQFGSAEQQENARHSPLTRNRLWFIIRQAARNKFATMPMWKQHKNLVWANIRFRLGIIATTGDFRSWTNFCDDLLFNRNNKHATKLNTHTPENKLITK